MKKYYSVMLLLMAFTASNLTMAQQTVLETFEDETKVPQWQNANQTAPEPQIVDNPKKEGLNQSDKVLQWVKAKDAPVYAALMTELEAYDIEFSGDATYLHIKMMKDNTDPCALQVIRTDDGISEAGKYMNPPVRIPCPVANEWVDYVIDFSAPEATSHTWSRFYFMAVMNATEEDGWEAYELDSDVNVYVDDIIIDSKSTPYQSEAPLSVFVSNTGQISYIINNPVTDNLLLKGVKDLQKVIVLGLDGSVVRELNEPGRDEVQIPVSGLDQGVYLVRFYQKNGRLTTSKIIKR